MIRSVQKAMLLLTVISDHKGDAVTLGELSRITAIPKPTCAHLIQTLCHDGYVKKISHSQGYILGPAAYYLSRYGRYENELITEIRPIMRWLERKTSAAVVLSVIQNHQKYIIEHLDSERKVFKERFSIKTDDIYRTATGRAILAQMKDEELQAVWKKNGPPKNGEWDEIQSYADLQKALENFRRQAVIITKGKPNVPHGFACPLFEDSICIGAIGIAWNPADESEDTQKETEGKLCAVLLKAVKEINHRLSYRLS